jgi:pentatricopeptide repeat protein
VTNKRLIFKILTLHSYGSLIRGCALVDQKEKAKTVYEEMIQKNLCPKEVEFEKLYFGLKTL